MTEAFAPTQIQRRGLMFVLSSPSGGGKTTITQRILRDDSQITRSVSVTTRTPRANEVPGKDYHFIDQTDFDLMVNREQLLEYAQVYGGHSYGTPRLPVENAMADGRDVMFTIDWQGARQLTEKMRSDVVSVFILPPSWHELERRLYSRAEDTPAEINRRMGKAAEEISHWTEYDYIVVNDDLEQTVATVKGILQSERLRRERRTGLSAFVEQMIDGH